MREITGTSRSLRSKAKEKSKHIFKFVPNLYFIKNEKVRKQLVMKS